MNTIIIVSTIKGEISTEKKYKISSGAGLSVFNAPENTIKKDQKHS